MKKLDRKVCAEIAKHGWRIHALDRPRTYVCIRRVETVFLVIRSTASVYDEAFLRETNQGRTSSVHVSEVAQVEKLFA